MPDIVKYLHCKEDLTRVSLDDRSWGVGPC